MKTPVLALSVLVLGLSLLAFSGCSRGAKDGLTARNPKEAASQLETAFANADAEAKAQAREASEAMRRAEYEKALVSLTAIRGRENATLEQGMAVHGSLVSLEKSLIEAMAAGEPNAKRAYELLKALKRN